MLKAVGEAVAKAYEQQPIVVVCDEGQEENIKKLMKDSAYRHLLGIDPNTL
jgi:hypothetical protein